MSVLVGQTVTRYWNGEKYVFERVAKGEWKCIYQDTMFIPECIISDLGD